MHEIFDFENCPPETAFVQRARRYASIPMLSVFCVHPMATQSHPKTLSLYLLDVSRPLLPLIPLFAFPRFQQTSLSFHDRVAVLSFHGPDSTGKIHARGQRERERGRGTSNFRNFAAISNVKETFLLFLLHGPGDTVAWNTGERWFRCTREQREETGRNGVGVRSLSPSLLLPSRSPPSDRGGACAWPGVGVADATVRGESLFSRSSISSRSPLRFSSRRLKITTVLFGVKKTYDFFPRQV